MREDVAARSVRTLSGITLSDAGDQGERMRTRRYLKSVLGVSDVALRPFELRGGRVILSRVCDAREAMTPT